MLIMLIILIIMLIMLVNVDNNDVYGNDDNVVWPPQTKKQPSVKQLYEYILF